MRLVNYNKYLEYFWDFLFIHYNKDEVFILFKPQRQNVIQRSFFHPLDPKVRWS